MPTGEPGLQRSTTFRYFSLDRQRVESQTRAMSGIAAPTSYDELWQYSVYCQILEIESDSQEELLRDVYADANGLPTVEVDFTGNLAYYVGVPGGGFTRATKTAGEFLCVRIPLTDENGQPSIDGAGAPIMRSKFVHYSQVFQPTEKALAKMDLTMVVLGIIYQHSTYTMAMLDSILDAMETLNRKMASLVQLFSEFTTRQTSLEDDEGAIEVSYALLEVLIAAGVTPPQQTVATGVIPAAYLVGWTDYDSADGYFVRFDLFYLEEKDGELGPHYLIKGGYYDEMHSGNKHGNDTYEAFSGLIISQSYHPGEYRGDIPAALAKVPMIFDRESVSRYFSGKDLEYAMTGEVTIDAGGDDAGILCYQNGNWKSLVTGDDKKESENVLDTTLKARYTPLVEPIENVVAEKKSFFLNNAQLQSWADMVRIASENLNSVLQNYSNMLSLTSSELQQGFSTASSIMAKLEGADKKTTRNIR